MQRKIWLYARIRPIISIMWSILASLIGQFHRRVKSYAWIFLIGSGPGSCMHLSQHIGFLVLNLNNPFLIRDKSRQFLACNVYLIDPSCICKQVLVGSNGLIFPCLLRLKLRYLGIDSLVLPTLLQTLISCNVWTFHFILLKIKICVKFEENDHFIPFLGQSLAWNWMVSLNIEVGH